MSIFKTTGNMGFRGLGGKRDGWNFGRLEILNLSVQGNLRDFNLSVQGNLRVIV